MSELAEGSRAPLSADERAELEQLGGRLGDRASPGELLRAFFFSLLAAIVGGISLRLYVDSRRLPYLFFLAALLLVAIAARAASAWRLGLRHLAEERQDLERFRGLRRRAGLTGWPELAGRRPAPPQPVPPG